MSNGDRRLAEIVQKTYPTATIWCLFDGLDPKAFGNTAEYLHTVAYLTLGLLNKAKEDGIPLRFISGGASSIRYCHKSTFELKSKIIARSNFMKPFSERFPTTLKLAGTVAPWDDPMKKKGWMTKGVCGKANFRSVEEFAPIIEMLVNTYHYNWIYGAYAADYYPFSPEKSDRYNQMIRGVVERKRKSLQ